MNNITIGIDPGASGGMAVFYPDGKKTAVGYKTEKGFSAELRSVADYARIEGCEIRAYVELLTGYNVAYQMTGRQGFVMGTSYGKILGALEALEIPHWLVTPKKWESTINGISAAKTHSEIKKLLNLVAKQRFPYLNPTLQTCDAILIAEYGSKQL